MNLVSSGCSCIHDEVDSFLNVNTEFLKIRKMLREEVIRPNHIGTAGPELDELLHASSVGSSSLEVAALLHSIINRVAEHNTLKADCLSPHSRSNKGNPFETYFFPQNTAESFHIRWHPSENGAFRAAPQECLELVLAMRMQNEAIRPGVSAVECCKPYVAMESNHAIRRLRNDWTQQLWKQLNDLSTTFEIPFLNSKETATFTREQYRQMLANQVFASCEALSVHLTYPLQSYESNARQPLDTFPFSSISAVNARVVKEIQVYLPLWSISELRSYFANLLALDEQYENELDRKRYDRKTLICHLLESCTFSHPQLQEVMKHSGLSHLNEWRSSVWLRILNGSTLTKINYEFYKALVHDVLCYHLLVDVLMLLDVDRTVNDSRFFIFEDLISQIALCLMHDAECQELTQTLPRIRMHVEEHSVKNSPEKLLETYPVVQCVSPSGILPIEGLSKMIAILCYVTSDPVEMYYLFRTLYLRFFMPLHSISSNSRGLLSLLNMYENLIWKTSSRAVSHIFKLHHESVSSATLSVDPSLGGDSDSNFKSSLLTSIGNGENSHVTLTAVRRATRWIQSAFADVLDVDQVLILWDLMIGYDTTLIFAVLAAALFNSRQAQILESRSLDEIDVALDNFLDVDVVSVLRQYVAHL